MLDYSNQDKSQRARWPKEWHNLQRPRTIQNDEHPNIETAEASVSLCMFLYLRRPQK
jgi:hypothetical protein